MDEEKKSKCHYWDFCSHNEGSKILFMHDQNLYSIGKDDGNPSIVISETSVII